MTGRAMDTIPAGFEIMSPYGPFAELAGPIYRHAQSPCTVMGLLVEEKHRNRRAAVHGGMVCTLVDTAMAYAVRQTIEARTASNDFTLVTTQMSISFIGNVAPGCWIETHIDVLRTGKRLGFASCRVMSGEDCIAQATGQFMVLPGAPDGTSGGRTS